MIKTYIAYFLIFSIPYFIYSKAIFNGFTGDSLDYFQLAREITENNGFATKILRPWRINNLKRYLNIPDMSRGPVYPIYLSLFFKIFGANEEAAKFAIFFLHLLIIFLSTIIGFKIGGILYSFIILFTLTLNCIYIKWSILGYAESLSIVLIMLVFNSNLLSVKLILLSVLVILKPTYILFLFYYISKLGYYSIIPILPYVFWTISRKIVSGTWKNEASMIVFFNTICSKSEQLYWKVNNSMHKFRIKDILKSLFSKVVNNVIILTKYSIIEFGEWILLSIILDFNVSVLYILFIFAHAFFHAYIRYLLPVYVFMVLSVVSLTNKIQVYPLVIVMLLLTVIRFIVHIFKDRNETDFFLENIYRYQIKTAGINSKAIITDIPWASSWYTGKLSIQIPDTIDETKVILQSGIPIDTIYMSPMFKWRAVKVSVDWLKILDNQPKTITFGDYSFKLTYVFSTCGFWDGRNPGLLYKLVA